MVKIKWAKSSKAPSKIFLVTKDLCKKLKDFDGGNGDDIVYHQARSEKIYVGLGSSSSAKLDDLRKAAAKALKIAKKLKKNKLSVRLPELKKFEPAAMAGAVVEGLCLADYQFDRYKTDKKKKPGQISVDLVCSKNVQSAVRKAQIAAGAANYARDLVNESAHVLNPQGLAEEALKLDKYARMKVTVFNEKQLKSKGLGLISAVGQGSPFPPRLIFMEYRGADKKEPLKAIVGKGLTFDAGGLNLKPSGSIETMRQDMGGSAAVLGTMKALCEMKAPVNVLGVVGAAYNAIDGEAYIPGDVYTSYLGKTVEIKNTDAEGRLVLADALAYTVEHYAPEQMVNLATLTGAIVIALGDAAAGLFANNESLAKDLQQSAENTDERLWRMPIYSEFSKALKGDIADLNNLSSLGRGASSCTAAAFLQEFVGKTPWAHLDIAGVAFNEKGPKAYVPKHGTGFGVRLLIDWLCAAPK